MQQNRRNKSTIKERIQYYLESKGTSKYLFYKASGISRGILDQETGISEENIFKFLAYARDISPSWLITGEGEMLKTKAPVIITEKERNKHVPAKGKKPKPLKCLPYESSEITVDGIEIPIYRNAKNSNRSFLSFGEKDNIIGRIRFPKEILGKGEFLGLSKGNSEANTADKQYVIFKKISPSEWSEIKNSHKYLTLTTSGYGYHSLLDNKLSEYGYLRCFSGNFTGSNEDLWLKANEIESIWKCALFISGNGCRFYYNPNENIYSIPDELKNPKKLYPGEY